MKELYLYGSGHRCHLLMNVLRDSDIHIMGVLDSDPEKWGQECCGMKIVSPDVLYYKSGINLCVTFYSPLEEEPIWDMFKDKYDINEEHLHSFHDIIIYVYRYMFQDIFVDKSFDQFYKVLFDATWGLGLGGVEIWIKDIVGALVKDGRNDIVLLTKKEQEGVVTLVEKHVNELFFEDTPKFSKEYIRRGIINLLEYMPCTVIFSRVDELLLSAYLLKQKYPNKISLIMTVHGSCDGMYRDILCYKDGIDKYVCVSKGIKKTIIERGADSNKVLDMTCPIPFEKELFREYTLNKECPIQIGYAGRIELFQKRMDILNQLIEELIGRGVDFCFNIAGDGTYKENLVKFADKKKILDKMCFWGTLERAEMPDFWKQQDIAVNTSDFEGRPLSNMEAMINGVVPVVTKTLGVLDDVIDGVNGYVVPLYDYVAMADRIQYLEQHRELLPRLGQQARKEMISKCSMERHIVQWTHILEKS